MTRDEKFNGWPELLAHLLDRRDLTSSQAGAAITEILNGDATPSQMTAFIVALRAKGETHPIEVVGRELRKMFSWIKTSNKDDYREGSAARG